MKTLKLPSLYTGFFVVIVVALLSACAEKEVPAKAEAPSKQASESVPAGSAEAVIRQQFANSRPDVVIESVAVSDVAGIYTVSLKNGPDIYVSADGKHFFLGDLFAVTASGFQNLAETRRNADRKALMAEVAREDMIIFSPDKEAKGAVYVFTDVDCGYCQKLHAEVPELNAMGIEVRYLAYPRAGAGSPTYNKMVSAWCADDRQEAMNNLKNRKAVAAKSCENPVAEEYELGNQVGVTGTPAIVTTDGQLIPGYMPAKRLAALAVQAGS